MQNDFAARNCEVVWLFTLKTWESEKVYFSHGAFANELDDIVSVVELAEDAVHGQILHPAFFRVEISTRKLEGVSLSAQREPVFVVTDVFYRVSESDQVQIHPAYWFS